MIVLDTSVVSYIFRNDSRARYYLPRISGRRSLISFQTVAEVWSGAYESDWGDRRKNELAHQLEQYEVVWASPRLVETWARLRVHRKEAGRELKEADAWIAATAVMLSCPLASHDRDFSGISGLSVIRGESK